MIKVLHGDCRDVLATLDADSIEACVTDAPYELAFMGRAWDRTGVAFSADTWSAVWRVLKPGAHLVTFGGTRTSHRMACAIEDAGFEIRDTLCWLYGQGFSKKGYIRDRNGCIVREGWAGSLKPAHEPIILARKPLAERTIAANVLAHGTGAINVDACRVETSDTTSRSASAGTGDREHWRTGNEAGIHGGHTAGRWPANVVLSKCDEVEAAFAAFGNAQGQSGAVTGREPSSKTNNVYGEFNGRSPTEPRGDTGTASRFFYSAKASKADRADSKHPTVKPVELMQWLVRLITPPGGTVLDPFAGSGTTGEAAMLEGFEALLIEQDAQHVADIQHRIKRWSGEDMALFVVAAE